METKPNAVSQATKSKLVFDEKLHKYTYEGKELESVTTWINRKFCKPFNALGAAIGKKKSSNNKGISCLAPNKLVKYWKLNANRAANYGTGAHEFAEMYDMDPVNTVPEYPKEHAFVAFATAANKKYRLIETEMRVYNAAFGLAGTIDRIYFNPKTQSYIIADLKTSKEMDKYYNKMTNELSAYAQSKINIYRAQLSIYSELYQLSTKRTVSELWIVHLKPDATYDVIKVEHMPEIKTVLASQTDYDKLLDSL